MADTPAGKPASPFAGLDTSLLRSTRPVLETPPLESSTEAEPPTEPAESTEQRSGRRSANRTTRTPTSRATTVSRNHDTTADGVGHDAVSDDALEGIRRAVRTLGKEAATYRFTQDEKRALSSIVYAYKDQAIRTSENEITRIALNYLIDDYRRNSANSILARVLVLLNQ